MLSRMRFILSLLILLCAAAVAMADDARLVVSPDSLFFRQLTSTQPSPLTISISANGATTLGAFTATATSTEHWLSVTPGSGTGATKLSVSANTTGLKPGQYSGSITITAQGFASATVKVQLALMASDEPNSGARPGPTLAPVSVLILRPGELQFKVAEGGAAPKPAEVAIFNPAGDSFSWTAAASVVTPAGGKWLTVSPASGTGKGVLKVQADPSGISAGEYKGQITVTSGSQTASLRVELDVVAPRPDLIRAPQIIVIPRALEFRVGPSSARSKNEARAENATRPQVLEVRTWRGDALEWTASVTVDRPTGGHWLSIAPTSGKTPGKIAVSADATGLAPGAYSGKVVVKSGTDSSSVLVFLRVLGPSKPAVTVRPRSLRFTATTGDSGVVSPASRAINVASSATGLTFTATATTGRGGAWLSVSPASGPVPGVVTAKVDPAVATKLEPGHYTGAIEVKVPGAAKEVHRVYVGLKVFGRDQKPRLAVEPGGVAFRAMVGGTDPDAQTVTLIPEGAASLAWTAAVSVASPAGGTWLSVSPTSGTTTAGTPSKPSIAAKIAGLSAGKYSGTVVFTPDPASGAPPVHLRVMLVMAAANAGRRTALAPARDPSASVTITQGLAAFFTSPPDGFISDVAVPPAVSVTVLDSLGDPVEGATVIVSSSNGEPDLVLEDIGGGQYEGSLRALSGGSLTLTGSVETESDSAPSFAVSGDMESSADSPAVIFQGGAVSAASFAASPAPLAPGSLVSLFGKNLTGAGGVASSLPLPNSLSGVSVTIGGVPAPLLAADPNSDQINLQVPFELEGQEEADIVVNANGVLSQPETVEIAPSPALFTVSSDGSGPGAFLHQNGATRVTASNPAAAGEVIVLYATGLGAVLPGVVSGDAGVGLSTVAGNVTVTIGGQAAQVQFAGLAPGYVGLYQINVQVPSGLPSGEAAVVLSVDGAPATGRATVALQ